MCEVTYVILWRYLEEKIKLTIIESIQSTLGNDHGIIKYMEEEIYKHIQIIECKDLERCTEKLLMD